MHGSSSQEWFSVHLLLCWDLYYLIFYIQYWYLVPRVHIFIISSDWLLANHRCRNVWKCRMYIVDAAGCRKPKIGLCWMVGWEKCAVISPPYRYQSGTAPEFSEAENVIIDQWSLSSVSSILDTNAVSCCSPTTATATRRSSRWSAPASCCPAPRTAPAACTPSWSRWAKISVV